ncbi:porin [Paraburkholderia sp. RL18-101-BIB-B]|uniref:porin n=1 Tax=Paraburkholderia sp. RL18-101-BIB-B TaxID=3031634 RepID=UPI0038BBB3BD
MNRKLRRALPAVAFAAMCGSGVAAAQSSVTLYGDVDAFVGAKKALGGKTAFMVGNGGATASFWGIKGSEDLGGGYQAIFELESYFSVQNGTFGRFAGDGFFSRNAWVGVNAPWGKLVAGQIGPLYWNSTIFFNPFFNSFVFSPAVIHTYVPVNGQGVGGGGGEWSNAVTYSTVPYGGWQLNAQYAFGNAAGEPGQNKWAGQVIYRSGALAANVVYQQIKFNTVAGDLAASVPGLSTQSAVQAGTTYDFGTVKLYGQYQYVSNAISGGGYHVNFGELGASIKVGTGSILMSDGMSKSGGQRDDFRNTWSVGYDYPLSGRTIVYAAVLGDHATNFSYGYTVGGGIRTMF